MRSKICWGVEIIHHPLLILQNPLMNVNSLDVRLITTSRLDLICFSVIGGHATQCITFWILVIS
jgi:hypothetical protein